MSRKARLPVMIPQKVEAKVVENEITIKGPKGTLTQPFLKDVTVAVDGDKISVALSEGSDAKNFVGLYWSLIANMVEGVSNGFEKKLEMRGVGYKALVQGNLLDLTVGKSHPTKMKIPEGIEVKVEKNTLIHLKGIDKQKVGQFAADIRSQRPPEPYKGKGIRYDGEYVRQKAGKAGKK